MAVRRAAGALFVTVCAALSVLALAACSFSASTANLSDVKMATDPDGKHPTEAFSPTIPSTASASSTTPPRTRP